MRVALLFGRDRGRGLLYRRDDVRIGGATANITAHIFPDVLVAIRVALLYASYRRHDLSGSAVAALESVVLDEGLLHRMRLVAFCQPLDREDLLPLGGERQRQA